MNTAILKKTRLWTLAAAVGISLGLSFVQDTAFVLGFLGTAVWSVLGFWAVEGLVRLALIPPGSRNRKAIVLLGAAKAVLYGAGIWVLTSGLVEPLAAVYGFSLLLIVLVVAGLAVRPSLNFDGTTSRRQR